jgi:hypothetical protein
MPVLRRHEIGLDEVRAQLDRERVALQGVRRQVAVRAAVADHERPRKIGVVPSFVARVAGMRGWNERNAKRRCEQQSPDNASRFHRSLLWLKSETLLNRDDFPMKGGQSAR